MSSNTNPIVTATPSVPSGSGIPFPPPQPAQPAITNSGGSADARNNAPTAPRNKKEPRQFATPSTATISSVPPMLLGVSNLPFYTNQHLTTNTFVPSTLILFAILAELDANMSNTHRFLQSAPNWIPLVSQVYVSVLFYIHVFRISRESGVITNEQFQLLQWFESIYDFRTMMIPGPLVPIFQSLAYVSGPFEWIGNVSPHIPDSSRPVVKNHYTSANHLNTILPNVPLIIDQIQWFLATFNITTANEHFITDNFYSNIFGTITTEAATTSLCMEAPHTRFPVPVSTSQYRAFKSQASSFRFPPRLRTATANRQLTWMQTLRFIPVDSTTVTSQWFSTISATMQRYCQFIRGSVPLSAISLTGLGSCTPVYSYQPSTALDTPVTYVPEVSHLDPTNNTVIASSPHFRSFQPYTLAAIGNHVDPELEELAEQYSAATQVNVSFESLDNSDHFPADEILRTGVVWNLPEIRSSPIIDVLPTHGPLIMTHYHSDSRNHD